VNGVRSPAWVQRVRGDCQPAQDAGPHHCVRRIDRQWAVACPKRKFWPEECDQGSAMADWPPDDGPGNPPPCRTLLDNRLTLRADGHAKQRVSAGSPVPWCTCQNTGWECNRGRNRRPDAGYAKSTGPP